MRIKYLNLVFIIFLISITSNFIYSQNTINIDSVKNVINALPNDTSKVNKINDFVWSIKMSNFNDAIEYGTQSYELAKQLNYTKGIAYATKNLGAVYYYASDNKNAYDYYKISLDAFKKMNDKKGIAIAYRNLGNVSFNIADWKQALDYYLKSLAIREEIGDKKGVAAVNDAIGLVYSSYKERDFKTPAEYHRKALKINKELNDQYGIATSYLYLGRNYYTKY
ncbi:MAG: tetratricopeptide repeat protein, partial [Chlorobi bacterium]|nr:tetratricopeptide repeat protein [Chlorobiota bacterium]